MGTPDEQIAQGKAATERIEQRTQQVTQAGSEGSQRWGWVRVFAIVSLVGLAAAVTLGVIGFLTTRDTRDAVETSEFSEQQRSARSNRADCIREYETDYRLADARFNAAIVNYLAFAQGSVEAAAALIDELERVGANLQAIQNGELCTNEEFGVVTLQPAK